MFRSWIDRYHNGYIYLAEGVKKIFSEKGFEMSSVSPEKLEKRVVQKSKHTDGLRIINVALRFTVHPEEKREKYVEPLDRMIKRAEKIINSARTKTNQRLKAMQVLTDLIKTSYGMIRDVEIELLEREVA